MGFAYPIPQIDEIIYSIGEDNGVLTMYAIWGYCPQLPCNVETRSRPQSTRFIHQLVNHQCINKEM